MINHDLPIARVVASTLAQMGWSGASDTSEDGSETLFDCPPGSLGSDIPMVVKASDAGRYLLAVRFLPFSTPNENRQGVAELLNAINLRLMHERFTIDFRFEGSPITVRSDITVSDGILTPGQVAEMLSLDGARTEYWPYISAVVDGEATFHEALEAIDRDIWSDNG